MESRRRNGQESTNESEILPEQIKSAKIPDILPKSAKMLPGLRQFSETELKIAETWSDILHVPLRAIGKSDTLFGLGGNSRMIGEFMERGYSFLNLSILFENLSLENLAKVVDNIRDMEDETDTAPIPVIPDKSSYPLSFEQMNMWNDIQEMIELSRTFQMLELAVHITIQFDSNFDENILKKSAQYVWNRHELLRSQINISQDGTPLWKPLGFQPMDFHIIDLTELNYTDGVKVSLDFETNILGQVVDLKAFPLIHFVVFKLAGGFGHLKIFTHHIIMDGASCGMIREEILECYQAFSKVPIKIPNLEPLPIQFSDYSIWQKQRFETNEKFVKKMKSYWQNKLANFKPLVLPSDAEPPVTEKHPGRFFVMNFPKNVSAQIDAFNKEQATISFVTLLAGVQVLLYRITGQTDLTMLSIAKGRTNPSAKNLIGHMMNFIILRSNLSGNPKFEDVVQAVHDDLMSCLEHQDYPFRLLLQDCCHGDVELQRQLYPTVVNMLPPNINQAEDITFKQKFSEVENWMGSIGSEWVFRLEAMADNGGYGVTMNYHKDRFQLSTIQSLLKKFLALLEDGIAKPTTRIDQILISHE